MQKAKKTTAKTTKNTVKAVTEYVIDGYIPAFQYSPHDKVYAKGGSVDYAKNFAPDTLVKLSTMK